MRPDDSTTAALRAAREAMDAYDLPLAQELLRTLRAVAEPPEAALELWIELLVDHLGDDRAALAAAAAGASRSEVTRARLALAAVRAEAALDARPWVEAVDPRTHPEPWARWIDALRCAGALDEAARAAATVRARRASRGDLAEAIERVDAALRPAREEAQRARLASERAHAEAQLREAGALLDEGRWAQALARLDGSAAPRAPDLRSRWEGLVSRAATLRERAAWDESEGRVARVERRLSESIDRESLRALAALPPGERVRVSETLVPEGFLTLIGDAHARTAEAIDATLALRACATASDPQVAAALLRPHESTLRRVEVGRRALHEVASRVAAQRGPEAASETPAGSDPHRARARVDAMLERGSLLGAWRRALAGGDERAEALGAQARARFAMRRDAEPARGPEEAHAELLRRDALVAHPRGADHARSLSVRGEQVVSRGWDLRDGVVRERALACIERPFVARLARWDRAHLALASDDRVLSVDALDGELRALWTVGPSGLIAARPRACADPDFAWVEGRDEAGARAVQVVDLAGEVRALRFGCTSIAELVGRGEVVTFDEGEGRVALRDAHGAVITSASLRLRGVILSAAPLPAARGAAVVLRERREQSAEDRRRARPPTFALHLAIFSTETQVATVIPLCDAARDDLARIALDPATRRWWIRLGPEDLPGALRAIPCDDPRAQSHRDVPAGVALRVTLERPALSFVSTRICAWQPDPERDPPGLGGAPLSMDQPEFAWELSCVPGASEAAWRAHGGVVTALSVGDTSAWRVTLVESLRSPSRSSALFRVLRESGLTAHARSLLGDALARHPASATLRLDAADAAWASRSPDEVLAQLEGEELAGLGEDAPHARHLLGLARLALGDERGAIEAWREGLALPLPRPRCALAGALQTLRVSRREAEPDGSIPLAAALAGGADSARLAITDAAWALLEP